MWVSDLASRAIGWIPSRRNALPTEISPGGAETTHPVSGTTRKRYNFGASTVWHLKEVISIRHASHCFASVSFYGLSIPWGAPSARFISLFRTDAGSFVRHLSSSLIQDSDRRVWLSCRSALIGSTAAPRISGPSGHSIWPRAAYCYRGRSSIKL